MAGAGYRDGTARLAGALARLLPQSRREPWVNAGMLDGPRIGPAAGGAARQLVVLLHGRGANGADLLHAVPMLARALPHAAFAAPDAPNRAAGSQGGREWFSVPGRDRLADAIRAEKTAAGVRAAAPLVDAFIDAERAALGLADDCLALLGFSQGCMMALHVGLRRPYPCAAILGYSGRLAAPGRLAVEIASRPPVLLCHGAFDPLVPFEEQGRAAAALEAAGIDVTTVRRPYLEHALDREGLEAGAALLGRVWAG